MPLKKVAVKSELHGAIAISQFELTYFNPLDGHPLECSVLFDLEDTVILSSFEATIDERVLHTKVKEKE